MTTFDPSLAALDRPDHLGGALQQGLPRPMNPKLTWSVIRTFLLGSITGGIVPILLLPRRLHDFAKAEQLQFWHLAEWLRLQAGDTEAASATEAAQRVMPGFVLRMASLAFLVVAVGIAWTALQQARPLVPSWLALTLPQLQLPAFKHATVDRYGWHVHEDGPDGYYKPHDSSHDFSDDATRKWFYIYRPGEPWGDRPRYSSADPETANQALATAHPSISSDLINAFALAISGAALCWLIEINTHIGRVRKFVGAFNQLSGRYGVGPVRAPGVHLGLRPLWILGAAALCALGGFWGAPLMLAAAAHRRYINNTSQRLRTDLARRQREVLLAKRPTLRVPASEHLLGSCPRENCRAPYPPEALYCRRCGMKLED